MSVLSGLRVLDLTHLLAGPYLGEMLAVMGAEVIKVESETHLDWTRAWAGPGKKGERYVVRGESDPEGINKSNRFDSLNLNKVSITLNVSKPEGLAIAMKLVRMSDVLIENFRPGALAKIGLSYATVSAVKPDIVMLSLSGYGTTGPESRYGAYASNFGPASGISHLTGYEDGGPTDLRGMLDLHASHEGFFAIMACLIHRQKTGRGQYIDLAARETVSTMIPDALMDYSMNKRNPDRKGNRHDMMSPHGIYPSQKDDTWISIAVGSDEEWVAFCRVTGMPGLAGDRRFADEISRRANQDDLDEIVSKWTRTLTNFDAMGILQAAGVAAVPAYRADELVIDPHLKKRKTWVNVQHPKLGATHHVAMPWRVKGVKLKYVHSPLIGQDNDYVFGKLLGMKPAEIADLKAKGVLK